MKRCLSCLLLIGAGLLAWGQDPLAYVDPFIGTARSDVFTRWGNEGGTYPGAVAPWGMMQLTPETRASGGYDHGDSLIYFFSCFHHLSGYPGGSAGELKVMPLGAGVATAGTTETAELLKGRPFRHVDEQAGPGYYKVVFSDDHSTVEATTSGRVGLFRYTFPAHVIPRIFSGDIDRATRNDNGRLQASVFPVVLRYDQAITGTEPVTGGVIQRFAPSPSGPTVIVLRISVSDVSIASAKKNIEKETGGLGFDGIRKRTEEQWRKILSVVNIGDDGTGKPDEGVRKKKTIFYTALYHASLLPCIISDVEGKYRGLDGSIHTASGKNEYGQFSPWDTFRSLHPLLCLLFPDRQRDMILSMLDIYRQTGYLPTESMTGNHALPILVDSWLKGIRGFDSTLAYEAMRKPLMTPPFLQTDMEVYRRMGYVPFSYPESVTRTVEYAYDDWVLGQFAGVVLHQGKEHAFWQEESYHYRNLFNSDELLLLPRNGRQFKLQPGTTGYKEGDKWVYSFFVPQHVEDLVNLMGGDTAFAGRLDTALSNQTIVFDNETVFHVPYLFNVAGRPDRTQYWVRKLMKERFSATPGGLPGNDDLGSLSSWYVLSAMGIYPVCPGRPVYAIGSPLFRSVTLHLNNGKQFVIKARGAGEKVGAVWINRQKLEGLEVPHEWIMRGGEMLFEMRDTGGYVQGRMAGGESRGLSDTGGAKTGKPDFRITNCSFSKKEVMPNELFRVRFSISNKGAMGTKIVRLLANGHEVGRRNCLVAAGETLIDSVDCRLYRNGTVQLGIEGMETAAVTVKRVEGTGVSPDGKIAGVAPVKVSDLVVQPLLRKGDRQRLSFTVQNIGGEMRSCYIPVQVNDKLVVTDTLLLEPGEKKTVRQELAVGGEGMQLISVMGLRENSKVYDRNEEAVVLDLSMATEPGDSVVPDRSGFGNKGRVVREGSGDDKARGYVRGGGKPAAGQRGLLVGNDCYIEMPGSLSLDSMGETLTMMAWVYPVKGSDGLVDIFTKGDNHVLQVVDNKKLSFFAGGWGRGDCTVDLPEDWLGHWHHIAGVCEGRLLRLYIDGDQKGSASVEGGVNLSNTQVWTLGRNEEFAGQRVFTGYMDGVKIMGAALNEAEIRMIMGEARGKE